MCDFVGHIWPFCRTFLAVGHFKHCGHFEPLQALRREVRKIAQLQDEFGSLKALMNAQNGRQSTGDTAVEVTPVADNGPLSDSLAWHTRLLQLLRRNW